MGLKIPSPERGVRVRVPPRALLKSIKSYFFVLVLGIVLGTIIDWSIVKYLPKHPANEFLTYKVSFGIENIKINLIAMNISFSIMLNFSLIMLIFGILFVILYKQL